MSPQLARTGTIEQTLRACEALALSPAFTLEMAVVADYMGSNALVPANLVDVNGTRFALSLDDERYGAPSGWVPTAFQAVDIASAIVPVPPYPRLQLFGGPGRLQPAGIVDTGEVTGWTYVVDAVVVAGADLAVIAERQALALMDGFERLIRRNHYLGGLVQLIEADGPPTPGGSVQSDQSGVVAGVMQRFRVLAMRSIV